MTLLIAGLAVFLGVHLLPAMPQARLALVAKWGDQRYRAIFSLASAAGLASIVAGYALSGDRVRIFDPLPLARALAPYAMTLSFILLAAANMRGRLRRRLQHPMLLGILVWSLVHLLANGDRAGTVLFGAFFAYALVDLASAIRRKAVKSFEPVPKHDLIAVVGGTAVALVVMTFHRALFGVPVVAFGI
jgi:uncharacterized membrane protein